MTTAERDEAFHLRQKERGACRCSECRAEWDRTRDVALRAGFIGSEAAMAEAFGIGTNEGIRGSEGTGALTGEAPMDGRHLIVFTKEGAVCACGREDCRLSQRYTGEMAASARFKEEAPDAFSVAVENEAQQRLVKFRKLVDTLTREVVAQYTKAARSSLSIEDHAAWCHLIFDCCRIREQVGLPHLSEVPR